MSEGYDEYEERRGGQIQDLSPIPVHIASESATPGRKVAPEYSSCMTWQVDTIANMNTGRAIRLFGRRIRRYKARIYVPTLGALGSPVSAEGSVTSPGASAVVVSIAIGSIPAGEYLINWTVSLDGTVSATDVNNFRLQQNPGGITLLNSTNDGVVGRYPQNQFGPIALNLTNGIRIVSIAAGTAGAVYSAQLSLVPVVPDQIATLLINSNESALMNGQGATFAAAPVFVEWFGQQPCYACLVPPNPTLGPVAVTVIDEAYEEI
jgi:hypothetical protein